MIAFRYHGCMGQILIRNVDDAVLAALKRRAEVAGRSMEAEAREALRRATRLTAQEKIALVEATWAETGKLRDPGIPWIDSTILIREDRDADDR